MIDRELRIIKIKEEISKLCEELGPLLKEVV